MGGEVMGGVGVGVRVRKHSLSQYALGRLDERLLLLSQRRQQLPLPLLAVPLAVLPFLLPLCCCRRLLWWLV